MPTKANPATSSRFGRDLIPRAALQEVLGGRLTSSGAPSVALDQLAGSDPKARLAILASYPPSLNRNRVIEAEIYNLREKDPATALQAVQTMVIGPSKERDEETVLTGWARIDPAAAIEKARELFPNPKSDLYGNEFITFFTSALATKDPTLAMNYALGLDEDLRKYPLIAAAAAWAQTDAVEALTWSYENGVNLTAGLRSALTSSGDSVLRQALQSQPEATIQWLLDLPQAAGQERAFWEACRQLTDKTAPGDLMAQPDLPLSQLFQRLSPGKQDDIAQTMGMKIGTADTFPDFADWTARFGDGSARAYAIGGAVDTIFNSNPTRVDAILASLPNGPDRDRALQLVAGEQRSSPTDAVQHALLISDETTRFDSLDGVISQWMRNDPEACRAYLSAAKEIPPQWKAGWLQKNKSGN